MCVHRRAYVVLCAVLCLITASSQIQAAEKKHRDIWLKNEIGEQINPVQNSSEPYSPRKTCGTCHGYLTITSGYHFQQGFDELREGYDKRRPWILSPGLFGKGCIPGIISGHVARKKNHSQRDIELSTYDWIGGMGKIGTDGNIISMACGWTHPGGGPLEYGRSPSGKADLSKTLMQGEMLNRDLYDGDYSSLHTPDGKSHFRESGVVEGDCLLCHMSGYRMNQRNSEIGRRNYRWAATAGAGLGEIKGTVFEFRDKKSGPGKSDFFTGTWNFSNRPTVRYFWGNGNIFTKEGKLRGRLINSTVDSKNCLQCHRDMNARKSGTLYAAPYDVHIAAGFQCTDCHGLVGNTKNQRLKHNIAKGWSPAGMVRNKIDGIGMKTCAGCHIEGQYRPLRANMPREAKNPTKIHKEKFPRASSHFNILHCAACHATEQPGRGVYLMDASTGNTRLYTADNLEAATPVDNLSSPASKPWKPWITRFEKKKGDGEKYIPCITKASQWFGEKQANGEVKPISLRYVRQAFKGLKGLTVVDVKNVKGEKVSESTVATHNDILLMIKALSNMGFTNVAFVADRIYENRQGKVVVGETQPVIRGPNFPANSERSQWFGERQETGEVTPIKLQYVLQAYRSVDGISMIERGKCKGARGMEPAVATNEDVRLMIKALSDMGFKNVVYVANRLYEMKNGKLKSFVIPATPSGAPPPLTKSPWFGEKSADGSIRPIRNNYVQQAMKKLKGLSMAEQKNARGEKVFEPTIATNADIERMIKALSEQGLKNVVFMANRVYEVRNGKLVYSTLSPFVSRPSYPVFHNVLPVEQNKTYGAKGSPDGCLDCHGENSSFFSNMKILNPGRFLKENYPTPKEPNAEPQMYEWGMRSVPAHE